MSFFFFPHCGEMILTSYAAMATRNPFAAKGHVPKLQPSTELHEPSSEPESPRPQKEKPNTQVEHKTRLLFARELEENLGHSTLGRNHDWSVHMEVLTVQAERRF